MRRPGTTLAFAAILAASLSPRSLIAHAGPRLTDPLEGATLGDTPTAVRLSFSEKPEASLSVIRVLDTGGKTYQLGRPELANDDPLALAVRVAPLDRGVYIVNWRIVSAVDGHVTAGAYAFGVRMSPTGTATNATTYPPASVIEFVARCLFAVGLVVLLGALAAILAGFGGPRDLVLAACGGFVAILSVSMLAEAQRRSADASFGALMNTALGRALIWRAAAVAVAGALLVPARLAKRATVRRGAVAIAALATLIAIAVHVVSGHAAAEGGALGPLMVASQWVHFSAAGIWFGGLVALLIGVRGAASDRTGTAVRRFSGIAAAGLVVVAAAGIARTIGAVTAWGQLTSSSYGRVVLLKIALTIAIGAFGALNRWRSVPVAAATLRPLRRHGIAELALAAGALAAAALLATLPPPSAAALGPRGLSASGVDFATSVRVRLTAVSDQPGPNRFTLYATDYDSSEPVRAGRIALRFTPLDDPGIPATSLPLTPGADGSYGGSGANMSFAGRWQVTVQIERETNSVDVPLEFETRSAALPLVRVARAAGQPPTYTVDVSGGTIRISPDPERAGPSTLHVICSDLIGDPRQIDAIVVTVASSGPAHQAPVRRVERGRFVANLDLRPGRNTIAVVARTADGTRLRSVFFIDVPR